MEDINATKLHRESGGMGHPAFVFGARESDVAFFRSRQSPDLSESGQYSISGLHPEESCFLWNPSGLFVKFDIFRCFWGLLLSGGGRTGFSL
jgi:hypothetical protein